MGGTGGRGAWLCRGSADCLEEALRRRVVGRALRAPLAEGSVARMAAALGTPSGTGAPGEDGGEQEPPGAVFKKGPAPGAP